MVLHKLRFLPKRKLISFLAKLLVICAVLVTLLSISGLVSDYMVTVYDVDDTRKDAVRHILSYSDMPECSVDAEVNVTWPWLISRRSVERFSTALGKVSKCVPSSTKRTVILNFIDRGYVDMLDTYLHHAKKASVDPILFITMDEVTEELLTKRKMYTFYIGDLGRSGSGHSGNDAKEWRQRGHIKIKMATLAVHLGYAALVADMDITYFKDPFPYLTCQGCDVEIQANLDVERSPVNSGFVYYRPTRNTQRFLLDLCDFLINHDWIWDQHEMNSRMLHWVNTRGLVRRVLPFKLFTPGKINQEHLYMYYDPPSELFRQQVMLHHLHQAYEGKVFRMKELGLWATDQNGYYSDPNARYITYGNPIDILVNMEWNALNNAFKLAALLNRKLILPKFHCQNPRDCPASRFGIKTVHNCYCSIIHLLQDVMHRSDYELYKEFEVIHDDKFREHVFLEHKLVPRSIKQSISGEILIESHIVTLLPQLRVDTNSVYVPKDTSKGPTRTELLRWFGDMEDTSVLRFKSLYGNFQL